MQFCIWLYIDIWKIIAYLQANPYRIETKNIISLIFISIITNELMLIIFLFFRLRFFKKGKGFLYMDVLLYRIKMFKFLNFFDDNTIKIFLLIP